MKDLAYYMSLPYEVRVRPLPEDEGGGYYAQYPGFGEATAHGDGETIEEAVSEARISLELTLEHYLENGFDIPLPSYDEVAA